MSYYLGDCILGGVDGAVTGFSIVSASTGASMTSDVSLIIGLAGVISDAFAMGAANYLSAQTMTAQGVHKDKSPFGAGLCTFMSFIIMGLIPLSIFILARFWSIPTSYLYPLSFLLTICALFIVGIFKGVGTGEGVFSAGLQTAGMGGTAAMIAYGIGYLLKNFISTGGAI